MSKLAQWLDLGSFFRDPVHTLGGAVVAAMLVSVTWSSWENTFHDPISGDRGNRLVMTSLNTHELLDRPTRLAELYSVDRRAARPAAPGRALSATARSQEQERRCLATGLYFEARGEQYAGQMAVAEVILNRVSSPDYPNTICGVVYQGAHRRTGCQFSFTCDGESDRPRDAVAWAKSQRLASLYTMGQVEEPVLADNTTHYHADYVDPVWASQLHKVAKIGRHIFYSRGRASNS